MSEDKIFAKIKGELWEFALYRMRVEYKLINYSYRALVWFIIVEQVDYVHVCSCWNEMSSVTSVPWFCITLRCEEQLSPAVENVDLCCREHFNVLD